MPLYEYHCPECGHVFELLRRSTEASVDQPCPTCDADSRRTVSSFEAFAMRGGYQRHLPDDGSAIHLGKKVSSPVNRPTMPNTHPEFEAKRIPPPTPPTVEELERYAEVKRANDRAQDDLPPGARVVTETPDEKKMSEIRTRFRQTRKQAKQQRRLAPNAERTARTRSGKHTPSPKPSGD